MLSLFLSAAGAKRIVDGNGTTTGLLLCSVGIAVAGFTAGRWADVLPGVFGVAGLNGIRVALSGELSPGHPISLSRRATLGLSACFFVSAFLAAGFVKAKPVTVADRLILLLMFGTLILGLLNDRLALWAGILCCAALSLSRLARRER